MLWDLATLGDFRPGLVDLVLLPGLTARLCLVGEGVRTWETSGVGGGGKKRSLKVPFPLAVATVDGAVRLARNSSSTLVDFSSDGFVME